MLNFCAFLLLWLPFVQGGFVFSALFSQLEYVPNPKVNSFLVGDYAPYFKTLRENILLANQPNPTSQFGAFLHNYRLAIYKSVKSGRIYSLQLREELVKQIKLVDDLASDAGAAILQLKAQNDTAGVIAKTEELVEIFRHRAYQASADVGVSLVFVTTHFLEASLQVFSENILIPSNINWVPRPTNFFVKDDNFFDLANLRSEGYLRLIFLRRVDVRIHIRENQTLWGILKDVFESSLRIEAGLLKNAADGGLFPGTLFFWEYDLQNEVWGHANKHKSTEVKLRKQFFRLNFGVHLAYQWIHMRNLYKTLEMVEPDTKKIIHKLEPGNPSAFLESMYQEIKRYIWVKEVADSAAVTMNPDFLRFFRQSEGPTGPRKINLLQRKISYAMSQMMYQLGRELFKLRVFPFAKEYSLLFPPPPAFTNGSWSASHGWEYSLNMLTGFEKQLMGTKKFRGWTNTSLKLVWSYDDLQEDVLSLLEGRKVQLQMQIEDGPADMHALVMDDLQVELKARDLSLNSQFQKLLNCYRINFKHPGHSRFKVDIKFYTLMSSEWTAWHSFPASAGSSPSMQTLRDGRVFLSPFTYWEMDLARGSCGSNGDLLALLKGREVDIFLNIREGRHVSQNTDWASLQLEDYYQEEILEFPYEPPISSEEDYSVITD